MTDPALDLFDDADLDAPVADAARRIAIGGFHALWRGRTPTLAELAGGDSPAFVEAAHHLRGRGRLELSDDGRVVAVHGLAGRPTRHRIEHGGGAVNTWCALDAISIPAALRIDARALTQCPTCGRELLVTLIRGEPQPQPEVVLWYPQAQCSHLVDDFCSGANLFCSIDHLKRWLDDDAAGRVLTIDEVAQLGRETWGEAADELAAGTGAVPDSPPSAAPPT